MALEKTWHVYGLIDPRDGAMFYVGCTTTPRLRLIGHNCDRASSAWLTAASIREAGQRAAMKILARFQEKREAYAYEANLISSTGGLVNKYMGPCQPGCLCGSHDPTKFIGNPNWAEEKDAKRAARERAKEAADKLKGGK